MCGIFGCLFNNNLNLNPHIFKNCLEPLSKRGPDNTGEFIIKGGNFNIYLGHTRLSIIDTSSRANQPMISSSGSLVITFNGEIYNHLDLRKKIDEKNNNINWKSTSDTETLINFIENFEFDYVLNNLEGMFAFSVFDRKHNKLILARDLAGEKPLYISIDKNFFLFSSDLNSFNHIPNFKKEINKNAVSNFLKYNYIPSPLTIYESTFKIPQSSYLILDLDKFVSKRFNNFNNFCNEKAVTLTKWWSLKNIKKNKDFEKNLSENEVLNDFETLLDNSVKKQLISDVPIGAFLSGGVDSSLILSQLIKHKSDVETFNIGFEFSNYDESEDANQVAKLFNTNHHNHICTKNEALNLIPDISSAFSEPFADSSQIPTMLVSKVASQQVKVILGGDGGDEIFGGYNRYLLAQKYWKIFKIFPYPINKILNLYKFIPKKILFLFFDNFLKLKNFSKNKHSSYEKILKKISNISDKKSFYENLTKEWMNDKILNYEPTESKIKSYEHSESDLSFEEWMMAIDFDTYMTDDILCKVDRASMFYSLEARSPLLSKSLVEYMFKLPLKYKINNGITKSIPKKLLSKYLPKEYIYKPKQGFGVPLAEWFRRDLKTYVFDNLSKNMCDRHSLFNHNEINKTLKDHFEKNIDCEHKLWSLMQFNLWYNNTFNK